MTSTEAEIADWLLTPEAVRTQTRALFEAGLDGKLAHFTVHLDKLPAAEAKPLLAMCDEALGQIVEIGPAEAIYDPPYHPYTEALLSAVPIADTHVEKKRIVGARSKAQLLAEITEFTC